MYPMTRIKITFPFLSIVPSVLHTVTMHRLFGVSDMVLRILMYLYPGDTRWDWIVYWKDGRALKRFALTCHAMFDIAVPLIWRCREDFTHLLGLLPRDLYDFHIVLSIQEDAQRDIFVSARPFFL